ncbi:MAG TPA: energy transducer TonB [Gemmatimonadales bacterium]|nr:energy transducer TonB [Gemmatimonadales bacterium]
MIQLFATSQPPADPLTRKAVTLGSLILHLGFLVALAVPLHREVRRALLDREVIYLVPLSEPSRTNRDAEGTPFSSVASAAGVLPGGRPVAPTEEPKSRRSVGGVDLELRVTSLRPAQASRAWRETALTELEVDSAVVRDPTSAAPAYPQLLLESAIAGSVTIRYVVDTAGAIDTLTYSVVSTTHPDFAQAVRDAVPRMRFRPAYERGQRVRQWVEQTFRFRLARDTLPADPVGGVPA